METNDDSMDNRPVVQDSTRKSGNANDIRQENHVTASEGNVGGQGKDGKCRKRLKTVGKVLLWFVGIWAVLLIIIQIVLSPSVLTRLANRFTAEYIDGNVSFGKVRLSVFRSFPYLNIGFSDVSVTYPSGKFKAEQDDFYSRQGRGETADTLASFKALYVSLDAAALTFGTIRIPGLLLEKPRIFAKNYPGGEANWQIFKGSGDTAETEDADTSGASIPKIQLGRIIMKDNPRIVYSSPEDTVYALLSLKRMRFNGRLSSKGNLRNRIAFRIDSMFVAGRLPSDTLALKLDNLGIRARNETVDMNISATTFLATRSYGRMRIPIEIKAEVSFPEDTLFTAQINDLEARIADVPFKANGTVQYGNRLYINGKASIDNCRMHDVMGYFRENILKAAKDIDTDASVSLSASFDGFYDPENGEMPAFSASLTIPEAEISNKAFSISHRIALDASAAGSGNGEIDLALNDFHVIGKALRIALSGSASDIMGDDPLFTVDAGADISLDTLSRFLRKESGLSLSGGLKAQVKGQMLMSQLDAYRFAEADVTGKVQSSGLEVISSNDTVRLFADSLDIWLGAVGNTRDTSVRQGERMLAMTASIDSTFISYKDRMRLVGKNLSLKAQNSAAILDKKDSSRFYPFGGKLDIGFLSLVGSDTSFVAVSKSSSIFKISPKKDNPQIPVLTLTSSNGGIFARGPINRIAARGIDINATAAMNSIERRHRAKAFVDSLARQYPDIPRDSLFRHLRKMRGARPLPDWLSEKDFMKQDLNLKLGDTMAKYFREWDAEGSLTLSKAALVSPYFPLRNTLSDVKGSFTNNEIRFDSFNLRSGRSDLSASGSLTGLRRALLGRGFIKLDLAVRSDSLNINELLGAYTIGSAFVPKDISAATLDIDDDEYIDMVATDTLANVQPAASPLIVVPANIVADLTVRAGNVTYSNLKINRMETDIAVKERCVQLTNTIATSDIGNIEFEGFYSTRTKQDLRTGFDLALEDITAEKVIEMMPAVDSVMPMLKSFKGKLNCTVSATAAIDTSMNIEMPTINGVIRIKGDDLALSESTAFSEIAKKLKFKDRTGGHIDHMSVEGLIHDNRLEVFPFVLKVDRYTLAMSGVQNLDTSFKYHVSVIDSPLPFRVGIDLSGNFDDFKFRIGKAKYKSTDVPVFSGVIDKARINLRESISNIFQQGVDKAIMENEQSKVIDDYKQKIGYTQAVDQQLDSLSTDEKARME